MAYAGQLNETPTSPAFAQVTLQPRLKRWAAIVSTNSPGVRKALRAFQTSTALREVVNDAFSPPGVRVYDHPSDLGVGSSEFPQVGNVDFHWNASTLARNSRSGRAPPRSHSVHKL